VKKKITTILTVLIWLHLIGNLWAFKEKTIKFEHISLEQGLSQSAVNSIVQDNGGFLWFGTQDGLNKYDGQNIKVYNHNKSDPHSISNNHIRAICKDRDGMLWIGTNGGGLNKFDPKSERAVCYSHDASNPLSLSHDIVFSLFIDSKGCIWIGTWGGGLNKFVSDKEIFARYEHIPGDPKSLSHNKVRAIFEDSKGILWVGTYGGGLNKLNREKGTFFCYRHDPGNSGGLSDERVMVIYESRSGILWVGTDGGGLNAFDREKESFKQYMHDPNDPNSLSHNRVCSIYEDDNGLLWIGTDGGGVSILSHDEKGRETFSHYQADVLDPKSMSNNRVMSIFESKENLIWIGTVGGGVNTFDREKKFFHCIRRNPNDPNSLSDDIIRAFWEGKDGALWIGTNDGGLNRFDREKGIFTHYMHNPACQNCISHNRVNSIFEDSSGVLWIGTFGGGLDRFDREKGRFFHYRHDPKNPRSLSDNRVRTIYEDSKGVLWIGTIGGGLNKMDREAGTFTRYKNEPGNPHRLSHDSVYVIYEDRSRTLWVSTSEGLNRYDREKNRLIPFKNDPIKTGMTDRHKFSSLSNHRISSILEDSTGILWIGTDGGGFNRFDPIRKTWKNYTEKDGLPNNVVYGILEETASKGLVKNLWLSTNKGITQFDPGNETFRKYDVKDGLQSNEFNAGASYKNKKGEMFFGGINGFNHFFPEALQANLPMNPVVITTFRKFNKILKFDKSIGEMEGIKLSHKDNFFSFEFVTPEYRNPDKIQYAHKLEGFDRDWVQCGTRRFANYTNVPGGKYIFRVKSYSRDGGESETSVKIKITPPFWQNWWFMLAIMGIALALVFMFNQIWTYSIRQRNRQLEVINKQLNRQIAERQQAELLQATLYKIVKTAHSDMDSNEIYHSIHQSIGQLIDAKNFYIALYDVEENSIFLPYFVDEFDDYQGHTIKASRGLTEYVIRTGKSILITDDECYKLEEKGEIDLVGERSQIWLGVPLTFKNEIFGAVVVQHYTNAQAYTEKDKKMLEFVSGQIASVIHSKREEEKKKELMEELHLSKKMEAIGRLAGGVAHDLNNVLSAIVSYPELLLMKLPKDSPLVKPLLTMKRSGQRAAAIVQDLLTLARRGVDTKEVVNWNDLINDYIKSPVFEELTSRHSKVEVEISLEEELLNIEGSPVHLTKALMNLCSNAAEAMPEGGKITIATKNLYNKKIIKDYNIENFVVVIISDTGVGIIKEDLKRIFEPFYTKKEMGLSGTGLGMTIVWNTINDHNGYINANSIEGKGTTFELYFPVSPEAALQGRETIGIEEYLGHGERILVVDDVQEQREIVTVLLNELGYTVDSVASGEEAIEYMKTHMNYVDLVILDMIMEPGMDGFDTYKKILKIQPGTKAIIASGFSETDRVRKTMRIGAGSYIQKPYTIENIGLALKRELEK